MGKENIRRRGYPVPLHISDLEKATACCHLMDWQHMDAPVPDQHDHRFNPFEIGLT